MSFFIFRISKFGTASGSLSRSHKWCSACSLFGLLSPTFTPADTVTHVRLMPTSTIDEHAASTTQHSSSTYVSDSPPAPGLARAGSHSARTTTTLRNGDLRPHNNRIIHRLSRHTVIYHAAACACHGVD